MVTSIFTGHALARQMLHRTRQRVEKQQRVPHCTVLIADGDAGMNAYAQRVRQHAAETGITLQFQHYSAGADALRAQLTALRDDAATDAVLTLYPMPAGLPAIEAAMMLGARKDVEGLHPLNTGLLLLGAVTRPPATARACMLAIRELAGSLRGKEVVIVGASQIVGRPLASLLLDAEATVTLCHVATRDLASHTRSADVVVTAAGAPGLIDDTHIREGAVLIDVSVVRTGQGLVGDVDLARVRGKAAVVTHVPDGVGPITSACLLENVVAAAEAARTAG